jgi:hypothetical protein
VYSILAIELLIHFNSVTGVYGLGTTGKIIPFVIGLATLWRTSIAIFAKFILPEMEEIRDTSAEHPDSPVVPSGHVEERGTQDRGNGIATVGHPRPEDSLEIRRLD